MAADPTVEKAQRDAQQARERLLRSAHVLQARVSPSRIANEALATARTRGSEAVDTVADAAQRQPKVAAAVGGGVALFLLRRPLCRLVRRLRR